MSVDKTGVVSCLNNYCPDIYNDKATDNGDMPGRGNVCRDKRIIRARAN